MHIFRLISHPEYRRSDTLFRAWSSYPPVYELAVKHVHETDMGFSVLLGILHLVTANLQAGLWRNAALNAAENATADATPEELGLLTTKAALKFVEIQP